MQSLSKLAAELQSERLSSVAIVERCLARYADPAGEGGRAFISLDAKAVRQAAAESDRLRQAGRLRSPFEGIPIAVKDLFDVAGECTRAGSRVFDDQPPAARDSVAVARLRAAGFIPFGRTNMTEFAYSGLGLNAHFGTPRSPWKRAVGHIPGGSTSGGAVAVADDMAPVALGSDTGGSCRIPAAFCGLAGFKPTVGRISTEGTVPLASSFDTIGSIGNSVECCAIIDAVLGGLPPDRLEPFPSGIARLAIPRTLVLDGLAPDVGGAFERAVSRLSAAGVRLIDLDCAELNEIPKINARGGIVNAEAWGYHRRYVATAAERYDRWVLGRFDVGRKMNVADYLEMLALRADLIARLAPRTAAFDALILPTVPIVPPTVQAMQDHEASNRANGLILRNTSVANFLNRCAVSIPCQAPGEAPVGLMLMGESGADRRLLAVAAALERIIRAE